MPSIKNTAVSRNKLLVVVTVFMIVGCNALKRSNAERIKKEYMNQFCAVNDNDMINCNAEWNQAKDHLLLRKANAKDSTFQEYAIYSLNEGEIYKSGFIGSSVEWLNNEEIIIKGTSRLSEESRIYNFVTKKTRTKL